MDLILTRHGETDWNAQKRVQGSRDIPLNQTGVKQAFALAQNLSAGKRPQKVYTSKQLRAKETGQIVARELHIPCEEAAGIEEMNLGLWEGLSWQQIEQQYPADLQRWINNRRYQPTPQGESYQDTLERVLPALQKIVSGKEESVLVVTHSAIIMALMAYLNDTPFETMRQSYTLKNAEVVILNSEAYTFT
ncbi:MAG: histidine phosphatase family protein [Oscillospiraceae bacterium]|nr:histidine phosphatase family protein [Oscillospiraceae bacterium]